MRTDNAFALHAALMSMSAYVAPQMSQISAYILLYMSFFGGMPPGKDTGTCMNAPVEVFVCLCGASSEYGGQYRCAYCSERLCGGCHSHR